ncbi:hypothetical protein Pcinc_021235 [Petrolisthes cinctipes]|uniref:Uncharacterized protein n=1 Tax=Petrolisthes cinctipes TaxID=88211 RepID=A0AAE1FHF4_PETCI|nr:hypothetical protein Pcinc_021235 [Petrolisthes cinctipes]
MAGEESAAAVQSGCGSAQASVVAVLVGVGAVWWCCGAVWASLGWRNSGPGVVTSRVHPTTPLAGIQSPHHHRATTSTPT